MEMLFISALSWEGQAAFNMRDTYSDDKEGGRGVDCREQKDHYSGRKYSETNQAKSRWLFSNLFKSANQLLEILSAQHMIIIQTQISSRGTKVATRDQIIHISIL